jgi:Flp pilus assembly protein TadG
MCVLVFGAVDVGRAFIFVDQLRNAAQAGAQLALSNPTAVTKDNTSCLDPSTVTYQVANEFSNGGPSGSETLPAGYTVTVVDTTSGTTLAGCGPDNSPPTKVYSTANCPGLPRTSVCSGDTILVKVQAPFSPVTPLIGGIIGKNLTLTGTSQVVLP